MKIEGIVSQVTERKGTTKQGSPVVYRDVFLIDANPDVATRYPGEIVIRPTDDEFSSQNMKEGAKITLFVRQILEVRNGLPVCRALVKQTAK
jgi:hypothetical protein